MPLKNQSKILAIDIGGTFTRFIVYDGSILKKEKYKTIKYSTLDDLIMSLKVKINKFAPDLEYDAVSFSIAGPVDLRESCLTHIPGLKIGKYEKNEITELFFEKKVYFINDANAAAYYEKSRLGMDNFIYITISSGIGGGIIKDGKVIDVDPWQSEIGYLKIDSSKFKYEKEEGKKDENYWQEFSSGRGLVRYFNHYSDKKGWGLVYNDPAEIFLSADTRVRGFLINEIGKINSEAISKITENLQIKRIIFGGSVALNNKNILLEGINNNYPKKMPEIFFTEVGDEICALGAALYAQDNF